MKKQRISDTISNLNEGIIEESITYQKATVKTVRRNVWIKLAAAAACWVLVLSLGVPTLRNLLTGQDKTTIDTTWMIEYENAYYEIIETNPEALEKFGVVTKVTEEVAGEHISYLKLEHPESERSDCIASDSKTEMELLEYKPAVNMAHRVFRDGEKYYIARFCNYLNPDDVSYPVEKALEIYGINKASDIQSVAATSWDNTWKIKGNVITDLDKITAFYKEIIKLEHYSEDEYHNLAFADYLQESETNGSSDAEIYEKHAEDLNVIVVETSDGIRFTIDFFPTFGWVRFSETQSYCKMSEEMSDWFSTNMN